MHGKEETGDTRESEFNSAALKMKRLNKIMEKLNDLNECPEGIDIETGVENYILIFRNCNSLFQEISPSLGDPDKKTGEAWRKVVENFISKRPVRTPVKHNGVATGKYYFNDDNWQMLSKGLWIYEKLVRDFVLAVGMDVRESQDGEGWD